jgi:hypothetical protein
MKKNFQSSLRTDLNRLADFIHHGRQAVEELPGLADQARERLDRVNDVLLAAREFQFPSGALRDDLRKLRSSMDRAKELINGAELGARSIQARETLDKLWREMP